MRHARGRPSRERPPPRGLARVPPPRRPRPPSAQGTPRAPALPAPGPPAPAAPRPPGPAPAQWAAQRGLAAPGPRARTKECGDPASGSAGRRAEAPPRVLGVPSPRGQAPRARRREGRARRSPAEGDATRPPAGQLQLQSR